MGNISKFPWALKGWDCATNWRMKLEGASIKENFIKREMNNRLYGITFF
jgi:hypothetical protein